MGFGLMLATIEGEPAVFVRCSLELNLGKRSFLPERGRGNIGKSAFFVFINFVQVKDCQ